MLPLVNDFLKHSKYNSLLKDIFAKKEKITINGLSDSAKAHFIFSIFNYTNFFPFIITQNIKSAKKLIQDLKFYTNNDIVFIPPKEVIYYNLDTKSKELSYERVEAINRLLKKEDAIFVTTIDSLITKMPKHEDYINKINIKKKSQIDIDELNIKLINMGYIKTELVENKGNYASRGGIIDIFPINSDFPVRIDFFGNEVEKIKKFDINTQRTIEEINNIDIFLSKENYFTNENLKKVIIKLEEILDKKEISDKLKENILEDIEKIKEGHIDILIDKYFDLIYEDFDTLLDYIDDKYYIYLDEVSICKQKIENIIVENYEIQKHLIEKEKIYPKYTFKYLNFNEINLKLECLSTAFLQRINRR